MAKEEILLDIKIESNEEDEITKLERLKRSILSLKEEKKNLDKAYKDGNITLKEYSSELVRIENSTKVANAAYSKSQKEVTGTKTALDKLVESNNKMATSFGKTTQSLNELAPGLVQSTQGMWGMVRASLAFIATPIGAVLAAIAAVLGTLVVFFKNSAMGADWLEDQMAALSAIFNVVIDRVTKFGEGLFKLLSGDLSGLSTMADSFAGIGDEIAREIDLAKQLAAAIRDLEDAEIDYSIAVEETNNQVKRLLLQSKNRTLSEQERINLAKQALELEKKQNEQLIANKDEALRIANAKVAQRVNIEKQANETEIQFGKRLLEELKKDNAVQIDDLRDAMVTAIKERERAAGETIAIEEKVFNFIDALEQKAEENRRKREEERMKESERQRLLRIERLEAEMEQERKIYLDRIEFEKQFGNDMADEVARSNRRLVEETKNRLKKEAEEKKKYADKEKEIERYKNDAISGGIDILTKKRLGARLLLTSLFKADAIKETVTNTYAAAVAAYKAMAGIPIVGPALGAVAAGLVTTFGLSRVAAMSGIQFFSKGGRVKEGKFSGPSHREGGITYYGTDGNVINVEGGENFYVLKKSASDKINKLSSINVSEGGVPFTTKVSYAALGGMIETQRAQANDIDIIRATVQELMANMPPTYVVAQDVVDVATRSSISRSRAQVL